MMPAAIGASSFGLVAIGRNEGERLRACLESVLPHTTQVVYVDSGSSDNSVAMAKGLGVQVVTLDMACPFTAARARNEGWRRLLESDPQLEYIQFVDGDCEIAPTWLRAALGFLVSRPDVAAVWGCLRERFPERSIYNRLCDMEWHAPAGESRSTGGNAMMRCAAIGPLGGFREDLIAGEDSELCVRLRAAGWKVWRLGDEMGLHDADMTRFGQWWKRSMRAGFAFAEGARLHGAPPERHFVRESLSAWIWGFALPVVLCLAAVFGNPLALVGFAVYPLQVLRLFMRTPGPYRTRLARAAFLVLGKFAEAIGLIKALVHRLSRTRGRLIEYK